MDVLASGALRSVSSLLSLDGGWLLGNEGSARHSARLALALACGSRLVRGRLCQGVGVPKGECQTLPMPGSFGVPWRSECVWMAPCESLCLCLCSEAPPCPTMRGPGQAVSRSPVERWGMLVSLITSLFTLCPLWQSQASASPPVSWWVSSDGELSRGHLTRLTLGEAGGEPVSGPPSGPLGLALISSQTVIGVGACGSAGVCTHKCVIFCVCQETVSGQLGLGVTVNRILRVYIHDHIFVVWELLCMMEYAPDLRLSV